MADLRPDPLAAPCHPRAGSQITTRQQVLVAELAGSFLIGQAGRAPVHRGVAPQVGLVQPPNGTPCSASRGEQDSAEQVQHRLVLQEVVLVHDDEGQAGAPVATPGARTLMGLMDRIPPPSEHIPRGGI